MQCSFWNPKNVSKVRKSFCWKGMVEAIRKYVQNCPVCQMEKSDRTVNRGKLQFTHIRETKWSEISIDFITDLPISSRNKYTVLVTVNKAARTVHLEPCQKNSAATATAISCCGARLSSYMGFIALFIQIGEPSSMWTIGRNCGV